MNNRFNQKSMEELQREYKTAEQNLADTRLQMNKLITEYSALFEESGVIRQKMINADQKTKKVLQKKTPYGTMWELQSVNPICDEAIAGSEGTLPGSTCMMASVYPKASLGKESIAVQIHVEAGMERVYADVLKNLPFYYDLYITCDAGCDEEKLCQMYAKLATIHDVYVIQLPEKVHSYAGIFVVYRKEILQHTFLLHYGGNKCNCVETSPRDLLGDEMSVRRILTLLSSEKGVSLLFTDAISAVTDSEELHLSTDAGFLGYGKKYYSYPIADSFWLDSRILNDVSIDSMQDFTDLSQMQVAEIGKKMIAACINDDEDFGILETSRNIVQYRFCDHYFQHCKSENIKTLERKCADAATVIFDLDGALFNINADRTRFIPRKEIVDLFGKMQKAGEKTLYVRNNCVALDTTKKACDILCQNGIQVEEDQILEKNTELTSLSGDQSVLLVGTMECANQYQVQLRSEFGVGKTEAQEQNIEYYPVPSFEMQAQSGGFRRSKADFETYAGLLFNSPYALNSYNMVKAKIQDRFHTYRIAIQPIFAWQLVQKLLKKNPHQVIVYSEKDKNLAEVGKKMNMEGLALEPGDLRLAACFNKEDLSAMLDYRYIGTFGDFMEDLLHLSVREEMRNVPVNLPAQKEELLKHLKPYNNDILKVAEETRARLRKKFSTCPAGIEDILILSPEFSDERIQLGLSIVSEYKIINLFDLKKNYLDPSIVADLSSVLRMDGLKKKEYKEYRQCVDQLLEKKITVQTTDLYLTQEIDRHLQETNAQNAASTTAIDYDRWYKLVRPSLETLSKQRKTTFKIRPKFSIVIPVFRTQERFLRMLLDSILHQTYTNFEICIADASDYDNLKDTPKGKLPKEVLQEYAEKDTRVRYQILDGNYGISENTNKAIDMATGDFIVFADHDDELTPDALFECSKVINDYPYVQMIYSDEDKTDEFSEKYMMPHFKPDFSPDLLTSVNYICHLMLYRRSLLEKIAEKDNDGIHYERKTFDGSQDYDLILRAVECAQDMEQKDLAEKKQPQWDICAEQKQKGVYTSLYIRHIPKVLYHWRVSDLSTASGDNDVKPYTVNAGIRALKEFYKREHIDVLSVESGITTGIYNTKFKNQNPLVSVIIPNKDHIQDLDLTIRSVLKGSYKNLEFIVIENNSTEKETWQYYEDIQKEYPQVKVVKYKGGFNYSKINNFGVQYAKGEYLLFLNNDTEMLEPDSISEMLGRCQRPDVGVVGIKLLYQDDTIQHAGVIVGIGGIAGHCFIGQSDNTYFNRAEYEENYSAVTAACMMSKRSVFDSVGGFTEELAVAFNDIDYCMKVRTEGLHVVYEPHAVFHHYESKSRGSDADPDKLERFHSEIVKFAKRWTDILRMGDPYYNPNLTLMNSDFSVRDLTKEEIGKPYYMLLTDSIINGDKNTRKDEQETSDDAESAV